MDPLPQKMPSVSSCKKCHEYYDFSYIYYSCGSNNLRHDATKMDFVNWYIYGTHVVISTPHHTHFIQLNKTVKQSRYRPGVAQRVPRS